MIVGWLNQSDGSKGSDSGYVLKVKLTISADGLDVGGKEKRGIKDDAKCFGSSVI